MLVQALGGAHLMRTGNMAMFAKKRKSERVDVFTVVTLVIVL